MAAEKLGRFGKVCVHGVGPRRVGGVDEYRFGRSGRGVVVVASDAAQTVEPVDGEALKQGVIHAVEIDVPIAQKQPYELAVLYHGAEIARSQSVAVAPELHRAEPVKDGGVERDDAYAGIVSYGGAVVELFGIVVLHVEDHGPFDALAERAVERLDTLAAACAAEKLRVGEDVVFRADDGEFVAESEEIDGHDIGALPFAAGDDLRKLAAQRRSVTEHGESSRRVHVDGARTGHMVAEILFHGHRGEEQHGVERVAQSAYYPFR